jgi:thiamine kinase-like enzyme
LLYARTEARFYSNILPLLQDKTSPSWDIAPTCFLAETALEGLIEEHETTSAKECDSDDDPIYDELDTAILQNKGGLLILESLKSGFYQTSPLTPDEATECLQAIAKFHATAYENESILETVSKTLCEYGGSYHLKNRNPKELKNIQDTWANFCHEVQGEAPEFFGRPSIQNLGKRVQDMAEFISDELSPAYNEPHATVVHGDYKAMNVFISEKKDKDANGCPTRASQPIIIDFASTGLGLGMSDVAMHITHAVRPENLANGGEDKLVEKYLNAFNEALPDHHDCYPKNIAIRHYRLAVIDYFRFVMGRLWRGATVETFDKRKDSKNSVFVNRNIDAAINFIERADRCLTEFETQID